MSGQIGIVPGTKDFASEGVEGQTEQVCGQQQQEQVQQLHLLQWRRCGVHGTVPCLLATRNRQMHVNKARLQPSTTGMA